MHTHNLTVYKCFQRENVWTHVGLSMSMPCNVKSRAIVRSYRIIYLYVKFLLDNFFDSKYVIPNYKKQKCTMNIIQYTIVK